MDWLNCHPETKEIFERELLDKDNLKANFENTWTKVFEDPELTLHLQQIVQSFDPKATKKFYKRLTRIMLEYDQSKKRAPKFFVSATTPAYASQHDDDALIS